MYILWSGILLLSVGSKEIDMKKMVVDTCKILFVEMLSIALFKTVKTMQPDSTTVGNSGGLVT